MSDEIEKLAKRAAIRTATEAARGAALAPEAALSRTFVALHVRMARAVLDELGCADGVVLDVRAAVSELREAECACSRITIGHDIHAEPCSRCAALRALTGGSDGE